MLRGCLLCAVIMNLVSAFRLGVVEGQNEYYFGVSMVLRRYKIEM